MDLDRSMFFLLGGSKWACPDKKVSFERLTSDSRSCRPGVLFVAKAGEKTHGEQYVRDALRHGAQAVVAERELPGASTLVVPSMEHFEKRMLPALYAETLEKIDLTGITGTKGKTTTAFFFYQGSLQNNIKAAYIGTVGFYTAEGFYKRNILTTPDIYDLYAWLKFFADSGHTHCVLEISSHAIVQGRIRGLSFQNIGFTNLSWDHLDYHHNMEEYFEIKKSLFTHYRSHHAFVNCDDPWGAQLKTSVSEITGFGQTAGEIRFSWKKNESESLISLSTGESVRLGMPGEFNVYNAVLAALLLKSAGCPEKKWQMGFSGVPGRLERIDHDGIIIYIDYAHTPDSLEKVLALLSQKEHKQLITVFGCTGDRDKGKRPEMGRIAARFSDFVIITSDDPHGEDPLAICRDVAKGIQKGVPCEVRPDREEAISLALKKAQKGSIVLIAGKGHERFQIFDGYEVPMNDRETVESLLKVRRDCGED
jgi:UDP-N-acetylmuramyl-tripeptide synthetase